jgi:uncharacterized membrane protein
MSFIKLYLISLPIFSAIDLLWVGVIAKNFYKEQIGHLMAPEIRWGAALFFYFLYLFGLVFFAVSPAIREKSWIQALLYGALFGLICYSTYDLTNLATLIKWPIKMVYYDLVWGAFASGTVSVITYLIGKNFIEN